MPKYFCAEKIYHNGQFYSDCALAVHEDGYIIGLLPYSNIGEKHSIHDFGDRILAPGWVDLQLNGCNGGLFNRDLEIDCLKKMLYGSLRYGTTSVQPTLITCTDEDIIQALQVIAEAQELARQAMQKNLNKEIQLWQTMIGMHLEGPYISLERRGAHPERLVRPLDETMLQKLEHAGQNKILTYITVAPESVLPEQVARLSACGITVFLGHSEAPEDHLRAFLLAGARGFTHLYNAMGNLNSRAPRTLGLALEDTHAYSSIIADGHHVSAQGIRIARGLLKDRLFLVTDATATTDGNEKNIFFGEQNCFIQNNIIINEEGNLAGSALTMNRGVEILSNLFGLKTALAMASANPVQALHPQNPFHWCIGSFTPGARANFCGL